MQFTTKSQRIFESGSGRDGCCVTITRLLLLVAFVLLAAFGPVGPGAEHGPRCSAELRVLNQARKTRVMIGNVPNRNYQIAAANLQACLHPNGVGKP